MHSAPESLTGKRLGVLIRLFILCSNCAADQKTVRDVFVRAARSLTQITAFAEARGANDSFDGVIESHCS